MRAGRMDQQIVIEKPVAAQDGTYGASVPTWAPLVPVVGSPTEGQPFWAEVQDVLPSRSEAVRQGLSQARGLVRIRMRYRSDIDSTMRVRVGSRLLQIVAGPTEMGRQEAIEIVCEEYSTTGAA